MKWPDKIGIGKLGLISFILLLSIGYFYVKELTCAHIISIFAEGALSVWITLYVIETAIKGDRERKWRSAKSLTYLAIMSDLRAIASGVIPFSTSFVVKSDSISTHARLLTCPGSSPNEEIGHAITNIGIEINSSYEIKKQLGRPINNEVSDLLVEYYKNTQWRFDDIKNALIPRVIELSDDEEANIALLKFEHATRVFADAMMSQLDSNVDDVPFAAFSLAALLKEAGTSYNVLLRKLNKRGY